MTIPETVIDFVMALGPLAVWIGSSILYRRLQGKPILFFGVRDATYQQRSASGHSNRSGSPRSVVLEIV